MTGIIVLVGIAAVLWGAVLACRASILVGCAGYVVATCCIGNEFWSVDAAGLTWTLDRFYLMGLVGVYIGQVLIRRTDPKPMALSELVLLGFLGLLTVSTFTHDWRTLGPDKVSILMHLVNGYLVPVSIYWIARQAALDERAVRRSQAVLACFGLYLAVTALCEIAGLWPLVFPKYIADPSIGIHFGRARGPMVQSAQLGTFMITCFVATWILLGWRERVGRVGMLLAGLLIPVYAAALFATYTRSVWIGAGLAAAVAATLTLQSRARTLTLGGMLTAAVLVLALKGSDLVSMERETSGAVTRESTYMRASFAYVSWRMFQDYPLTGVGFGHFPRVSPYYLSDRDTNLHLEAIRGYIHHNTFLSILVELGIAGIALFLLLLFAWTRNGVLLWRDSGAPRWMRGQALLMLLAFAPYFCQLTFREVSYSPQENAFLFLLAGITSGLSAMRARQTQLSAAHERFIQSRFASQGA